MQIPFNTIPCFHDLKLPLPAPFSASGDEGLLGRFDVKAAAVK
jgi:hypothetical protein